MAETPHAHGRELVVITTGTIVRTALIIALFALLFYLRDIILLTLTSVVIASAIEPMTLALTCKRLHRTIAVIFIYIIVFCIVGAVLFFFLPPLLDDISQLTQLFPRIADNPGLLTPFFEKFPALVQTLRGVTWSNFAPNAGLMASDLSGRVVSTAALLFNSFIGFILTVVLSFYLSVQEDGIENFLRLITPEHHEAYVVGLWQRSRKKIGLWMQGQLLLALLIAVFVYLGLTMAGIKYALVLAMLAAFFEIIPVFGPIMAAVPGVAVGFSYSLTTGFFVLAFYTIIQQFESHLIYPLVVRKIVGIPPLLSVLALIIGAELAGFIGIILAVPLATVLVEIIADFEKHKKSLLERSTIVS